MRYINNNSLILNDISLRKLINKIEYDKKYDTNIFFKEIDIKKELNESKSKLKGEIMKMKKNNDIKVNRELVIGGIYKHFKGNKYKVICLAEHIETSEKLVINEGLYGKHKIYATPLKLFMLEIDKRKYPNATQKYKFELINKEL